MENNKDVYNSTPVNNIFSELPNDSILVPINTMTPHIKDIKEDETIDRYVKIYNDFTNFLTNYIKKNEFFSKDVTINIYWGRHAESCANLYNNHIEPGIPRPRGYDKIIKGAGLQDPNSFNGGNISDIFNSSVEFVKGIFDPISKILAREPPITFIGTQQAILLNQKFIIPSKINFDRVFCSTLTRAAMTSLFGFRYTYIKKIYVVPFIHEISKPSTYINFANYPNSSLLLKKKLKLLKIG